MCNKCELKSGGENYFIKSLTPRNSANLGHQDCVGVLTRFDWQWPANIPEFPTNCQQVLIQILLSHDWSTKMRDITMSQLSPPRSMRKGPLKLENIAANCVDSIQTVPLVFVVYYGYSITVSLIFLMTEEGLFSSSHCLHVPA